MVSDFIYMYQSAQIAVAVYTAEGYSNHLFEKKFLYCTFRWRDNLKFSDKNYAEFKKNDALRKRLSRKKPLNEEQKERMRRSNAERQRKFREKRKNLPSLGNNIKKVLLRNFL